MEYLLVLNDSPYGSQRTYNALRLAGALAKSATMERSKIPIEERRTDDANLRYRRFRQPSA